MRKNRVRPERKMLGRATWSRCQKGHSKMKSWLSAIAMLSFVACPSSLWAQTGTIGFDNVASGTIINNQYASHDVTLGCYNGTGLNACTANAYAVAYLTNNSPPNVVSLTSGTSGIFVNEQKGYLAAYFAAPVSSVSVDALAAVFAEFVPQSSSGNKPYLNAYGPVNPATGKNPLLATAVYSQNVTSLGTVKWGTWETLSISTTTNEIAMVVFSSYFAAGTPVYGIFDNLKFSSLGASGTYIGCYSDDANRAMPVRLISSGATVESCIAAATAAGFPYAGLQWYGVCYAGYSPAYAQINENFCYTSCASNPSEMCGGAWATSMYRTHLSLPVPVASANLGCYTDDANRALDALLFSSGATVETCFAAAKAAGFAYAGLQAGGQCFAGNSLAGYPPANSSFCHTACTANPAEYCGGSYYNNVYATGLTPSPIQSPVYEGCYTDDANRAFNARLITSGATVESCVGAAHAMGYAYAGLQWKGSCWAGNSLGYSNTGTCDTPCSANPLETCGGAWSNSVYSAK